MSGLPKTRSIVKGLVVAALVAFAGPVSAQTIPGPEMQGVIASYNDFIDRMSPSPLTWTDKDGDLLRLQRAHLDAKDGLWLKYFPTLREEAMRRLQDLMTAYQANDRNKVAAEAAQLGRICQEVRYSIWRMNGSDPLRPDLAARGRSAPSNPAPGAPGTTGTPGAPAPGTPGAPAVPGAPTAGTPTPGPGTTTPPPANPGARPVPGAMGPGGTLLGVGTNGGPGGPAAPTGSTSPTAAPTGSTSPTATGTPAGTPAAPGSTSGAVARAGGKQSVTQAESLIQTLLSDQNLANGAIIEARWNGPSGRIVAVAAATQSLGEIAALIRPLSARAAGEVQAIEADLKAIAEFNRAPIYAYNANYAFQQYLNEIRGYRQRILQNLAALNARLDS